MTGADRGGEAAVDAVLAATGPVLLDFDGPVTFLMADGVNAQIASAMRAALGRLRLPLPDDVASSDDPFVVLRFAATQDAEVLAVAEGVCRDGEIQAAAASRPTPGARELLLACQARERPVVIVSNNASDAIEAYLDRCGVRDLVRAVFGRPDARPDLMKPHPSTVETALGVLDAEPDHCVFVGDSVTDVEVSRLSGTRSIGFAKTQTRGAELAAAGADALVEDIGLLAEAVLRLPRSVS